MLKTHYGKDWFRGKLVGGAEGIFPKNFVEVVVCIIWPEQCVHLCLVSDSA